MKKIVKKNQIIITILAIMIAVAGYLNYAKKGMLKMPSAESTAANGSDTYVAGNLEISDEDIYAENQAINVAKEGSQEMTDAAATTAQSATGETTIAAETTAANNSGKDTPTTSSIADSNSSGQSYVANEEELEDIASLDHDELSANPGDAVLTSGVTVSDFLAQAKLSREQNRGKNKETLLEIVNNTDVTEEQRQNAINSMINLTDISEKENAAETLLKTKGFDNAIVTVSENAADVVICKSDITDAEKAQIEDIVKRKTGVTIEGITITLMEVKE